jgi:hypothetical protein
MHGATIKILVWMVFHFIFALSVTLQFIFIVPFHQKHVTQKEFPQLQPTLAYHTARTRNPVTYQLWLYSSTLSHATVCMNTVLCCDMTPHHLLNKANLVQNLFLAYLFLVYLSISTRFQRLCAHHQEKQLCLYDTWYLLFCVDDCLVCRVECFIPPSFHPAYQTVIHTE